ncbi:MAG: ankyrin repeat domain-containing protein [Gemmataceae bacterium]
MPRGKLPARLIHEFCDLAHSDANVPRLKTLLAEHPELLHAARPGKDKETALGAATHSRARKVIRLLLDQGVSEDVFLACALGDHAGVEKYLAQKPKLVTARASHVHQMDLIDLAPDGSMVALLLERGYPLTIHGAAAKGLIDQLDRLLADDPALLESKGREGETPLFCAIWSGQDEAALHLLEKGCRHDVDGATARPLSYACTWGRSRVARVLLDKGVDIQFRGFAYRYSHLHACCGWGEEGMGNLDFQAYTREILTIIRWLFEAGIDLQLEDKKGQTARELALAKGFQARADLIEKLSERTARKPATRR